MREYLALVRVATGRKGAKGVKQTTSSSSQVVSPVSSPTRSVSNRKRDQGQEKKDDVSSNANKDTDKGQDKEREKTPRELEMIALWEVKVDVELRRRAIQYQLKQFRRIMDGNMTSMFKIGMTDICLIHVCCMRVCMPSCMHDVFV